MEAKDLHNNRTMELTSQKKRNYMQRKRICSFKV
jgi:hypothetical protein